MTKYPGMAEHVEETLKRVEELYSKFYEKHTSVNIAYELRIKINELVYGTSDVVIYGINKKTKKIDVLVIDYKYGQGVLVHAEENIQCVAYLIGAVKTLGLQDNFGAGMVVVAQVRLEDGWSDYVVKAKDFKKWENRIIAIADKAKAVFDGKLPIEGNMQAGSHCRFCKCLPVCPEHRKNTQLALSHTADELPIEEQVKKLTLDEQVAIFIKKSHIEDFLDAVAKNLTQAFENGITHPELKLIQTNGRRVWVDEERVAEELTRKGIDPYKKSLIGITEAEKQGSKKVFDHLTKIAGGKLQLVHKNHKSPAVSMQQAQELPEE